MSALRRVSAYVLSATVLALPLSLQVGSVAEAKSYRYRNCAQLHQDFKHGVGKTNAKDKVSGSSKPVTNFKRSTKIYNQVIKHNKGLDRDKDGIACEAH